jgi:hypothetical protein
MFFSSPLTFRMTLALSGDGDVIEQYQAAGLGNGDWCEVGNEYVGLMICREKGRLDATQWFIELTISSTCFGHYYAHHQELETKQVVTACGT